MQNEINYNSFEYYESQGYQQKFWFKKKLEEILEGLGQPGKIADINFAYHNSWLVDALRVRGDHIKYQQWDKLNELNRVITERIHADNHKELNEIIIPKCAFVSIEDEKSYNALADQSEIVIAGETSKVSEAPEPTNVIWENRDFDKNIRYTNLIYVIIAVVFVLFLTFLATVKAKSMTNDLIGKYDDSVNCEEMNKMYKGDQLSQLAADEWIDYYKKGGDDIGRQIAPTLSCFCTQEYMHSGNDAAENTYKASDGSGVKTCSEIFSDRASVGLIAMGVSFLIVGVNFALKMLLVELIKSLRLKTVTKETNYTMITIFVGQFINTAVLIVLNNASFKDFDGGNGPMSLIFFVGSETDFSVTWYKTVGTTIMRTMTSQAIWPLIEFGMFWSLLNFSRCLDRKFTSDTFITSAPSVQAYIDLYAGPEYLIHYRYAAILLQIGVAFCYGAAMPPLYGIACVAFVILYINERLLVCYYYREPPAFDEKMTALTLDLVSYVPYIMLPMAFWQLGNRQIYETVVTQIDFKTDVKLSQHNFSAAFSHMDPTFMTYNSGPMWLLILIMLWSIYCWATGRNQESEGEGEDEEQLFEGLADYYDALKEDDKQALIGQEEYFARYEIKTFSNEQFTKLKQSEKQEDEEKIIMGVATYRILDNLAYQQALQYEPNRKKEDGSSERDGVICISTSEAPLEAGQQPINDPQQMDATYLAVNLAFLKKDKQLAFNMDTSDGKKLF